MHSHQQRVMAAPLPRLKAGILVSAAEAILRSMADRLACGELTVELPSGQCLILSGQRAGRQAKLRIHRWRALARFASAGALGFGEAYAAGDWSSPDLVTLLTLAAENHEAIGRLDGLHALKLWNRFFHALNRNTMAGSRRNIAAHYDLGNGFYRHWLDDGMSYSSAIFPAEAGLLEAAQLAKLDRVIDMLNLESGDRVLEIGCGWGSMAERLLERHDGPLIGITLSAQQLVYAQDRLRDHVRTGRCELRLQDYREVTGVHDRIVSIEMLEAVGEAYWPVYFRTLRERLRDGGIAVLQAITIDDARFEAYRRRPDFIQKHVFPGGMLPTPHIIEREAARAGLVLTRSQFFGDSYARTLAEWNRRFQRAWSQIAAQGFDDSFKRKWEFYLAYCQAGFASGALDVGLYRLERSVAV